MARNQAPFASVKVFYTRPSLLSQPELGLFWLIFTYPLNIALWGVGVGVGVGVGLSTKSLGITMFWISFPGETLLSSGWSPYSSSLDIWSKRALCICFLYSAVMLRVCWVILSFLPHPYCTKATNMQLISLNGCPFLLLCQVINAFINFYGIIKSLEILGVITSKWQEQDVNILC